MFTRSFPRLKALTPPSIAGQLNFVVPLTSMGLQIRMLVKPDANVEKVTNVSLEKQCIYVSVAAPAREGRATRRVHKFMSELLGLREGEASIVAGERSRLKVIRIHSQLSREQQAKEQVRIFKKLMEAADE